MVEDDLKPDILSKFTPIFFIRKQASKKNKKISHLQVPYKGDLKILFEAFWMV